MVTIYKYTKKDGKDYYKFRNLYLGVDELTDEEVRVSKSNFTSEREAKRYDERLREGKRYD